MWNYTGQKWYLNPDLKIHDVSIVTSCILGLYLQSQLKPYAYGPNELEFIVRKCWTWWNKIATLTCDFAIWRCSIWNDLLVCFPVASGWSAAGSLLLVASWFSWFLEEFTKIKSLGKGVEFSSLLPFSPRCITAVVCCDACTENWDFFFFFAHDS